MKGNSAPAKSGVCYWTLALLWGFYPHKDSCASRVWHALRRILNGGGGGGTKYPAPAALPKEEILEPNTPEPSRVRAQEPTLVG